MASSEEVTVSRLGQVTVVLLGMLVASCGGGGGGSALPVAPVLPTPPPSGWSRGTIITVVSGETDAPVAAARLIVAGVPQVTDGAGQVVAVTEAAEGATVDVVAEGFLPRQTLVRNAVTRLTVWPDNTKLPGDYTRAIVYTASTVTDSTSLVPLERLPPRVRTLALVPGEDIASDPRVMAAHRQAADYFNVAAEGRTVFSVGGTADMTVPTRLDPADSSCEGKSGRLIARTSVSRYEVTRAEIIFCGDSPTRLPMPITHELAHIFGLGHSIDRRDVMYPYYSSGDEHGFTDRETLTMRLVYLRRGGNTWSDNDRTATTSGKQVRVFVD
jgi:hypothetical protein